MFLQPLTAFSAVRFVMKSKYISYHVRQPVASFPYLQPATAFCAFRWVTFLW